MPRKRIINKDDYPMVTPEGWEKYKNTHTKLPCVCQGCGCIIKKTIKDLDEQKSCYCYKCGIEIKRPKTCMNTYGYESHNQSPNVKEKRIETTLKNHGVKYPSQSKQIIEKMEKTSMDIHGYNHPSKSPNVKDKKRQTNLKNHGVENVFQSPEVKEKSKQTNKEKFGYESHNQSPDIKEKKRQTNLKNHGVENVFQSPEIKEKSKQTLIVNYGVENISLLPETTIKRYNTKRKNGTFNTSKPEDECYQLLCSLYGESDIKRNYNKDSRYPFQSDFYIISEDLFIECNFHWTHGKEPFNENNEKHNKILDNWKNKNTKFYRKAIDVWTVRDPLKVQTAMNNGLNYHIFYSKTEFILWVKG